MTINVTVTPDQPVVITQDDPTVAVIVTQDSPVQIIDVNEQGPPGPVGPVGPIGPRGNATLYGSGPPNFATGVNGDFYIDTTANFLYGPKAGVWPSGVSLVGPQGQRGSLWYVGSGAPGTITGQVNGDNYLNSVTGDVWQLLGGTWTIDGSIQGPVGPTGATGATGAAGATPHGYLFGLTLSNVSAGTFSVAAGEAFDSTFTAIMTLASSISKTNVAWAVGTGNGALDTGLIATGWYHVHEIKRLDTNVVDIAISLSATAPTFGVNIPAAYTKSRRIGAMLFNISTGWVLFSQNGDEFLWATPFGDYNALSVGTTAQLLTLSVPSGVKVTALFNADMVSNTAGTLALFNSPDQTSVAANAVIGNFQLYVSVATLADGAQLAIRTNTGSQVRCVSSATAATCTVSVATQGWIDTRGRLQ
jgi:hypothetical protein